MFPKARQQRTCRYRPGITCNGLLNSTGILRSCWTTPAIRIFSAAGRKPRLPVVIPRETRPAALARPSEIAPSFQRRKLDRALVDASLLGEVQCIAWIRHDASQSMASLFCCLNRGEMGECKQAHGGARVSGDLEAWPFQRPSRTKMANLALKIPTAPRSRTPLSHLASSS